jgi:hypothetical protein
MDRGVCTPAQLGDVATDALLYVVGRLRPLAQLADGGLQSGDLRSCTRKGHVFKDDLGRQRLDHGAVWQICQPALTVGARSLVEGAELGGDEVRVTCALHHAVPLDI